MKELELIDLKSKQEKEKLLNSFQRKLTLALGEQRKDA